MEDKGKIIRCLKCDNVIGCITDKNELVIKKHGREITIPMYDYVKIKCEKCEMVNKISFKEEDNKND